MSSRHEPWPLTYAQKDVEIARLRALSQNNAHSWDAIVKERNDLRAEIERRRADMAGAIEWCQAAREGIGAVDGYDYRSGEEFGLRRAEIELRRRSEQSERILKLDAEPAAATFDNPEDMMKWLDEQS